MNKEKNFLKKLKEGFYLNKLDEMFKLDLFKYFEVSNNPKREKCFFLAYEYGHSSGNLEIFNYFSELVELIK